MNLLYCDGGQKSMDTGPANLFESSGCMLKNMLNPVHKKIICFCIVYRIVMLLMQTLYLTVNVILLYCYNSTKFRCLVNL